MKLTFIIGMCFLALHLSAQSASVYFKTGSASVSKAQIATIEDFLKAVDSTSSIKLVGFADATGSSSANKALAKSRANSVKQQIHGPWKIKTVYYGSDSLTYTDDSLNRRVDILVVESGSFLAKGRMVLENCLFIPDKASFYDDSSEVAVANLARIMRANPEIRVMIEGHVCCAPGELLSERRARTVYNYLTKKYGIDSSRLEYKGFSNTRPLYKEDSNWARQQNRRVEVRLLEE